MGMVTWSRKDTLPLWKRTLCQEAEPKRRGPVAESSKSHSTTSSCGDVRGGGRECCFLVDSSPVHKSREKAKRPLYRT